MTIAVGQPAPAFTLSDHIGTQHALSDYAGQWVLLYFYPKDDTPGCTTEACSLRDNLPKFSAVNAVVLGVSTDSVKSHAKFVQKYGLPFTLLADEDKIVVNAYGVQGMMGTKRTSFLIDPAGKVARIYENVKPAEHVAQVLADL
ncbi:MAG TPA: peroxiredoxin [Candidatus Kerfeldbacteria bacterium]|nr:peroxiredoxin [Candidatus Kerfeldbacteria bacterium]